jgi:hypothetical protein
MIVCGMHGRKGPKEDSTIVGSTVAFLQQEAKLSILIIKDMIPR